MYHWVLDTVTGKVRVHIKAATEMFIRRWLITLKELVKEYDLTVDVMLVTSTQNMADQLTRVLQQWFNGIKKTDPGH